MGTQDTFLEEFCIPLLRPYKMYFNATLVYCHCIKNIFGTTQKKALQVLVKKPHYS